MKPVDGIDEKERAYALIEIFTRAPIAIEFRRLRQQLRSCRILAIGIKRQIANCRIRAGNDLPQLAQASTPGLENRLRAASTLISSVRIWSRSLPLSASASCALKSPYL